VLDFDNQQNSQCTFLPCNVIVVVHVYEQEVPLTLKGQRGRCIIIKGKPQIYGSFPNPKRRLCFPLGVVFMVSLDEHQLHAKFEVVSFSRCTILKGNPKMLESSYSTGHYVWFYGGPWQTHTVYQI